MIIVINIFLTLLGLYFGIGLITGLYFLFKGAVRLDPLMQETKKRVRILLLPGIIATWPFLITRLFKHNPS